MCACGGGGGGGWRSWTKTETTGSGTKIKGLETSIFVIACWIMTADATVNMK